MATLHDLTEAFTFDISKAYLTYLGKRGSAMKEEIEASAWKHLVKGLKPPHLSDSCLKLHQEYVAKRTIESQIVHAADNLDILLQVVDLRRRGYPQSSLKEIWNETMKRLRRSSIRSARAVLKMIAGEAYELSAR